MVNPLVSIIASQIAPGAGLGASQGAISSGAGVSGQGGLLAGNPFIQLLLSQNAQTQLQGNTDGLTADQLVAALAAQGTNSPITVTPLDAALPDTTDADLTDLSALVGLSSGQNLGQVISNIVQAPKTPDDTQINADAPKPQPVVPQLLTQNAPQSIAPDGATSADGDNAPFPDVAPDPVASALGDKAKPVATPTQQVAGAAQQVANTDNSRLDALKKAFKFFEAADNANPNATAVANDKSAIARAVQAYGGTSDSDNDTNKNSTNDSGLVSSLFKQPTVQTGSSENGALYNNISISNGDKVIDPLSSAAVAAKNPVPNSLSHNPTAAEQVSLRVANAIQQGESRITIHLEPADLGQVEVKLNFNHTSHTGTVQVTADRPETLQMLKGDSRLLERALNDAGIKTDAGSLSFDLRGDNGGQPMQFSDYQSNQQNGYNAYGTNAVQGIEEQDLPTVAMYRMNIADGIVDIMV